MKSPSHCWRPVVLQGFTLNCGSERPVGGPRAFDYNAQATDARQQRRTATRLKGHVRAPLPPLPARQQRPTLVANAHGSTNGRRPVATKQRNEANLLSMVPRGGK